MASIPTRRILATRPCLRAAVARMSNSSSCILRATFNSSSSAAPRLLGEQHLRRVQLRDRMYTALRNNRDRSSSSSTSAPENKIWTFEDIQSLDPTKTTLIDVREPGEVSSTGLIRGALNIPIKTSPDSFHISDSEFEARHGFARPPRDAELVFYCKAGVRSRAAAGLARDAGWSVVGEYPGSWNEWSAKGADKVE
ncbi:Rhodanese-like domain-containing protein [Xylaria cf. heliscus]|nr:Rhodanese-like domain-containing protein [Xylaria cf. heliscus]